MSNPNQCSQFMTEKEILQDGLISQKLITDSYNTFAGECTNIQLRDTFLDILKSEHQIQSELFGVLQSNGWYQTEPAQTEKIDQMRQKYSVMC